MRTVTISFFGIDEFKPADGRGVLIIVKSGLVLGAYYNKGFWDCSREDAVGYSNVEYWAYSDFLYP
jgi:hypothetical protein